MSAAEWKANPVYRHDTGYLIDERWALVRHDWMNGWILTHRPTGFSAARCLKTKAEAVKLVQRLYRKFGRGIWDFTDPEMARSDSFKGARTLIEKFDREEVQ